MEFVYTYPMNPRTSGIFLAVITIACYVAGALVYPHVPLTLITHWDAAGRPNGSMGKFWGLFLLPIILLILDIVWYVLPKIDPLRKDFIGFRHVYDFFWILLSAFLAYVYALTLAINIGLSFNLLQALLPAIGVFIFCLGALMPYVKRNWFFGIRTPWTLSSESNWDRTHQFGGKLFMLAGVIAILAGLAAPHLTVGAIIGISVGADILAALASIVYSYVLYHREERMLH